MPPNESRTRLIDFLRGGSAIAVALFHFNEGYPSLPDYYHRALKWGWVGVSVFFVISGFCIASAASRNEGGVISFWFRRLARIYPPYWGSLLVVLSVVSLRLLTFGTNDVTVLPKHCGAWMCTFIALPSPASSVVGLNWVYWSLTYELAFYIMMGLTFLPFGRLCLVILSITAFFAPFYPFDQWCLFGLGVGCFYIIKKRDFMSVAILAVCILQVCFRLRLSVAFIGILTATLLIFPSPSKWVTGVTIIRRIGVFSYSLYLVHVPVGRFLAIDYLPWLFGRESFMSSIARDSSLLAVSLIFAYGFYVLAEKPAHELARRTKIVPSRN